MDKATAELAATAEISQNVAGAACGAKLVITVLNDVAGATTETRSSVKKVLTASQSVEAAEVRYEVRVF
jgi:methyl-accepting chemotaxis protein